jgi:hypothetical protein
MRYILILLLFVSCASEKKIAKICAEKYPIKDSTIIIEKIDTTYEYIKGDSIKIPFYIKGDVIYKDTICPPVKVPKITKSKEKIVYQENTAKNALFELQMKDMSQKLAKVNDDNKKLEDKVRSRTKQRNILFIILGIIILFRVLKYALYRWLSIN